MYKLRARIFKKVVEDLSVHSDGTAKVVEEKMEET